MERVVWVGGRAAGGQLARFGVPLGLGSAFQAQRRDLVLVGGFGDRRRLDVSALGGAGEQIALQHHGSEDAALDVGKNTAEVVGAPAYGQRGKAGVVDEFGEGFIQVLAEAQEGSDHAQEGGDSVGHGFALAALLGVGPVGLGGACGRVVHGEIF